MHYETIKWYVVLNIVYFLKMKISNKKTPQKQIYTYKQDWNYSDKTIYLQLKKMLFVKYSHHQIKGEIIVYVNKICTYYINKCHFRSTNHILANEY